MYLKPRLEGNESILLEEQVNKKRMNSTRYGLRIFFVKERGEKAQLANECALLIHFETFLKRKYWWELRGQGESYSSFLLNAVLGIMLCPKIQLDEQGGSGSAQINSLSKFLGLQATRLRSRLAASDAM